MASVEGVSVEGPQPGPLEQELLKWMDDEQRSQWESSARQWFDVKGSDGCLYRLGRHETIHRIDKRGETLRGICITLRYEWIAQASNIYRDAHRIAYEEVNGNAAAFYAHPVMLQYNNETDCDRLLSMKLLLETNAPEIMRIYEGGEEGD